MKHFFNLSIFLFIIFNSSKLNAQNLVPNPSFELYDTCPTGLGQTYRIINWSAYSNTPEYYNSCATGTSMVSCPYNFAGYQTPLDGNAYAGFCPYSDGGTDFREAIGCSLLSSLSIGQKYFVSFFVVNAGTVSGPGWNCCINKLGMRFSTIPYSFSNPIQTNNSPHVYTDSIIKDSINWIMITGSFVADSNYQYLAISNFFDDLNTDTSKYNNWACVSYYLLDGICVSTDSIYTVSWTSLEEIKNKNIFKVFPNPTNGFFHITYDNDKIPIIKLYNSLGGVIQKEITYEENDIKLNINGLNSGIYFLQIELDGQTNFEKIILIN